MVTSASFHLLRMDFKEFQTLYNFRKRSEEELSLLSRDLQRDRSSSRSSYSSRSSSSSSRSSITSSSSSSSASSRSLPYSIRSHALSSDSEDLVDELLEEPFRRKRKRRRSRSVDRKRSRTPSIIQQPSDYQCTVFVTQLPSTITEQQIEDFFSRAGAISAVQLCFDPRTFQFENAALVEFYNMECVLLVRFDYVQSIDQAVILKFVFQALGLNGQKISNTSIIVQPSKKHQIQKENDKKKVTIEFKQSNECKMAEINAVLNSQCPPTHIEAKESKLFATFVNLVHAQKVVRSLKNANCEFEMLLI